MDEKDLKSVGVIMAGLVLITAIFVGGVIINGLVT